MVLVLLDNLFFKAKINEAAAQTGMTVKYVKKAESALAEANQEIPSLIILDLDAAGCSPLELLSGLKSAEELRSIPTLGFVSHVNTERQEQARAAGCDRVLARSAFDRDLISILRAA